MFRDEEDRSKERSQVGASDTPGRSVMVSGSKRKIRATESEHSPEPTEDSHNKREEKLAGQKASVAVRQQWRAAQKRSGFGRRAWYGHYVNGAVHVDGHFSDHEWKDLLCESCRSRGLPCFKLSERDIYVDCYTFSSSCCGWCATEAREESDATSLDSDGEMEGAEVIVQEYKPFVQARMSSRPEGMRLNPRFFSKRKAVNEGSRDHVYIQAATNVTPGAPPPMRPRPGDRDI